MRKKTLWLGLSFLLVASLVLASCAETVEPVEPVEPTGLPQYGGTLTAMARPSNMDPPSPDIMDAIFQHNLYAVVVQEHPVIGDFERFGPRGTGEYDFQLKNYVPPKYYGGLWLEDWEISQDKIVWTIRPGIYWQGRDVMESRELVADDVVADIIYFSNAPGGKKFKAMSGDIYSTGRYTLVIEYDAVKGYDFTMHYYITVEDRAILGPPETAGSKMWEDLIGTGPFMFKEYVVGSHISFDRNPNYWATTTIDGVEYELPFIDKVVMPVIPDASTRIAALRTGKVDYDHVVAATYWDNLAATAPGLLSSKAPAGTGEGIVLKSDQPPFDDIKVRQAMMIGTDLKAFAGLAGPGLDLPLYWYPLHPIPGSGFIPMDELPTEAQLLYTYDPVLAREMLDDAGIPDGLKIEYHTSTRAYHLDRASLLKDMWAKIGIEVEIKANEYVTYTELRYDHSYVDTLHSDSSVGDPIVRLAFHETGNYINYSNWTNERFDELVVEFVGFMSDEERALLISEAALIFTRNVSVIPTNANPDAHFWWPWIKNYYGERNVADQEWIAILSRAWLDLDLKAEMGY